MEISAADLESPTTEAALWHNVVESFKFAYADRMMLSDPNFDEISRVMRNSLIVDLSQLCVLCSEDV